MQGVKVAMQTILCIFSVLLFHAVGGIRNVALVMPSPIIRAGTSPVLLCLFDLEGARLYSVKWYRGQYEFFRYMPEENPPAKIFHIPGIYVDIFSSNEHHVTLRNVPSFISGEVSCEVTTDSPGISTACVSAQLNIQTMNIDISVAEHLHTSGQLLIAECAATTDAKIVFFLNSIRVPHEYVTQTTSRSAVLNMSLSEGHYPRGDIQLQCSGGVSDQYYIASRKVTVYRFFTDNGSYAAAGALLLQIIMGCVVIILAN